MYLLIVALTMLILPVGSVLLARNANPAAAWVDLIGLWFVFWGVGVRLGLAGLRQIVRPEFTARDIFGLSGEGALVIVRELGFANLAIGIVGLLAWRFPAFVLPAAIYATVFYAAAGAMHVMKGAHGMNETVALASDLFMALVLGGFAVASLMHSRT
jgi:hypothetical protein